MQELATVESVDLQKYSGKWYSIANLPTRFQQNCKCTTAEYQPKDGYVQVYNRCYNSKKEKWEDITGKAFPVKNSNNSKLKVQFFWPFRGKYWIIGLAGDYSYAMVGHPNRQYLWLLSRTPQIDEQLYKGLLNKAAHMGFDVSKMEKTVHNCY